MTGEKLLALYPAPILDLQNTKLSAFQQGSPL
jgi:hypothetical protein